MAPLRFGDKDYIKLEQNESRTTFAKRGEKASESRKRLLLDIERCFDSGFFDKTVSPVKGKGDDVVDTGARVVKDVEARATGIQMDWRDIMRSNGRVAEGTLAAIDSFLGNSAREEVAIGSTEVDDSGEGSSGGRKQKRTSEGEEDEVVAKVRKTVENEDKRTVVDMDMVNQGTVVACLSRLIDVTERHNRTLERIESLLVDNTVVMSKNADSTTRLMWAIERYEKNESFEY